jgi:TatD DNase family protein
VKLFDSHLHLTDAAFTDDRGDVMTRARDAGVSAMVTVASNPADARTAVVLAGAERGVWTTVGLHPHEARDWGPDLMANIAALVDRDVVVALGETGLDFHYDNSPRTLQAQSFEAHLELAAECGLPVVVHSRSADAETEAFIRCFAGRATGVLHCFSGGPGLLETALDAGWHISFSGIITFRNYPDAELVRRVPRDRLLIETDSPYLAPVPHRGRRNEPAFVEHTCRTLAELRGEPAEEIAELTFSNACVLYGIGITE